MERNCKNCGRRLKPDASFCSCCGARVSSAAGSEALDAWAEGLAAGALFTGKVLGAIAAFLTALACVGISAGHGWLTWQLIGGFVFETAVELPWLTSAVLSGAMLLPAGIVSLLLAIGFLLAALSLIRSGAALLRPSRQHPPAARQRRGKTPRSG